MSIRRAAASVNVAPGSIDSRAPVPTLSVPPATTPAAPLDCKARLTALRKPSGAAALASTSAGALPVARPRVPALACQDSRRGLMAVASATVRPSTPSRLMLAKPPWDRSDACRLSRPVATASPGLALAIVTWLARRLRLPPLASARAMPRSVPPRLKATGSSAPPSTLGLLLSSRLPALPPLMLPLPATRTPPETSSSEPVPSTRPAPERRASVPPVMVAVLGLPSRRLLTKRPARSSCTVSATRMSPAGLPLPGVLRPLVKTVRLPPALRSVLSSVIPSTPRAARVRLLRSGKLKSLPGAHCRLPSVASSRLPKPAPASVMPATREPAGSALLSWGAAQKASLRRSRPSPTRSDVASPVPAKAALPKLPALSVLPRRNWLTAASASRPACWRSPMTVLARRPPSSTAWPARMCSWPPARPSP